MDQFDYSLPDRAIAQSPADPRDSSRLLVAKPGTTRHLRFRDLPGLIEPGDVLVVNDTRVIPARLRLQRPGGGACEVLLLEESAHGSWEALVRPSRKVAPGARLRSADGIELVEAGAHLEGGRRSVRLLAPEREVFDTAGELPLPPYITEPLADPDRYQTTYARHAGSVAAPTAGLHLTPELVERCEAAGAEVRTVDLTVGLDTFRPVTVDHPADHVIHTERYRVPTATWEACRGANRVVAVGTTVVRALESAARGPLEGRTELFIRRPFRFAVVDVLITNFHLPRSSLLLLVDAFVGARWRSLYDEALAEGYRFLSFGDAMWLEPADDGPPDHPGRSGEPDATVSG